MFTHVKKKLPTRKKKLAMYRRVKKVQYTCTKKLFYMCTKVFCTSDIFLEHVIFFVCRGLARMCSC